LIITNELGAGYAVTAPDLTQEFEVISGEVAELGCVIPVPGEDRCWRIQRPSNGQVVFTLSGRMDAQHIAELETLIGPEANRAQIVLDLHT
jgi:hypothetical protein